MHKGAGVSLVPRWYRTQERPGRAPGVGLNQRRPCLYNIFDCNNRVTLEVALAACTTTCRLHRLQERLFALAKYNKGRSSLRLRQLARLLTLYRWPESDATRCKCSFIFHSCIQNMLLEFQENEAILLWSKTFRLVFVNTIGIIFRPTK